MKNRQKHWNNPNLSFSFAVAFAVLLAVLPGVSTVPPAGAEVRIELHDEPLVNRYRIARAAATDIRMSPAGPSLFSRGEPGASPTGDFWFIHRYFVDTTSFGDTTLWSARNESLATVSLTAQYFDVFFVGQQQQDFSLDPNELVPVNVRDVGGLPIDPDGFARGFVRLGPNGPISADVIQVDTSQNFATASLGSRLEDFCGDWQVRFVSFGQSSILSFLVNGPRGPDPGDPATVVGDVYNEAGSFVNSFTLRTDEWVFDRAASELVVGGLNNGTIELTVLSLNAPPGLVFVNHSAEGRFSVGYRAVCRDTAPL